mmetsp:Transcript_47482/g.78581  ORF Transcript_47482/g.78581 Transcript_47482/m.78581 type:complete len:218 (-) Transcript_47482:1732-2385(-)
MSLPEAATRCQLNGTSSSEHAPSLTSTSLSRSGAPHSPVVKLVSEVARTSPSEIVYRSSPMYSERLIIADAHGVLAQQPPHAHSPPSGNAFVCERCGLCSMAARRLKPASSRVKTFAPWNVGGCSHALSPDGFTSCQPTRSVIGITSSELLGSKSNALWSSETAVCESEPPSSISPFTDGLNTSDRSNNASLTPRMAPASLPALPTPRSVVASMGCR